MFHNNMGFFYSYLFIIKYQLNWQVWYRKILKLQTPILFYICVEV